MISLSVEDQGGDIDGANDETYCCRGLSLSISLILMVYNEFIRYETENEINTVRYERYHDTRRCIHYYLTDNLLFVSLLHWDDEYCSYETIRRMKLFHFAQLLR